MFDYAGLFAKMQQQERVERVQRLIAGECDIQDEAKVIISESLGAQRAVELDPVTGSITILDAHTGVQLTALQVLVLTGFLKEHDACIALAAYAQLTTVEDYS